MATDAIRFGKKFCDDIEFSPEDASLTEPNFLCEVVEAVIGAGVRTVNIHDTVGYAVPDEFGALISNLKQNVKNIDKAVISVHCHNDLGMSVANSLGAITAGARQVEGCINGLGERAGNAALEEIIMAIETRPDLFGVSTTSIRGRFTEPADWLATSLASRCSPTKPSSGRTPSGTPPVFTRTPF